MALVKCSECGTEVSAMAPTCVKCGHPLGSGRIPIASPIQAAAASRFCRTCGKTVNERAVACTSCGCPPTTPGKFCHGCGADVPESAVMCIKCGVGLGAGSAGIAASAAGKTMIYPKNPPASPVVAGLLCWLWGGAGSLYVGQQTKGIVLCLATLVMFSLDACSFGLFLLVHGPIAIALIVDAVLIAKRLERGEIIDEWKFF